jgi:hypothetical protein
MAQKEANKGMEDMDEAFNAEVSGVTVVLLWCYSGVIVVLQWCHSGVTVVLQWCYSSVTVVSQW